MVEPGVLQMNLVPRDPHLVLHDEDPPDARVEVDVNHQKRDQFDESQSLLEVFVDVQELDDLIQLEYSAQLQDSKQLQIGVLRLKDKS